MTMLVYENIEDFMEKLRTLENTTAVYMTVVHMKQNDSHMALIRMQFAGGDCLFHTYNYSDNINPVPILDMRGVEALPSDELKKTVLSKYQADLDRLNAEIEAEYEKAKQVFIKLGYTKIVNAYTV